MTGGTIYHATAFLIFSSPNSFSQQQNKTKRRRKRSCGGRRVVSETDGGEGGEDTFALYDLFFSFAPIN